MSLYSSGREAFHDYDDDDDDRPRDQHGRSRDRIHRDIARHRQTPRASEEDEWSISPPSPTASDNRSKAAYYLKLDDVRRRVLFQTEQYPQTLQDYVRPVTRNKRAMYRVVTTFDWLDSDSKFLSRSAAELIQGLQSVSDAQEDMAPQDENVDEDNDDGNDDEDNYDDDWGVTYEPSDDSDLEEKRADEMASIVLPDAAAAEPGDRASSATAAGFMAWRGFDGYGLSRKPDIVNDRRKSLIAIASTVSVMGVPTPEGTLTAQGLLSLLAAVLRRQDWRAYYQASSRAILVPRGMPSAMLTEYRLEEREHRVLGTTKYLTSVGRPTMTCLTYNDGDYGSITLFDVHMRPGSGTATAWPAAIRPYAVLPRVPKKLLKKIAKDMPRSKKTELRISSKKDQVVWSSPTSKTANGTGSVKTGPAYDRDLEQTELSKTLLEALPVRNSELARTQPANCVVATIPAMLAWLHVRSAYLTNIKIEGTRFLERPKKGEDTTKALTKATTSMATFVRSPDANDHHGDNPAVIVLHPHECDWVTAPLHWA